MKLVTNKQDYLEIDIIPKFEFKKDGSETILILHNEEEISTLLNFDISTYICRINYNNKTYTKTEYHGYILEN